MMKHDSSLLEQGYQWEQYPPGSTFKVVTALDYFRTKGTFERIFLYDCQGSITLGGHTIQCYQWTLYTDRKIFTLAFANSCNCAFAEI